LAARYSPILRFDAREPFLPLAAGYTIFRQDGPSPSFQRGHQVELAPPGQPPASFAIEYAIWWDWDIGHLYELEHVWVFVDAQSRVVRGEASWHGRYRDMCYEGELALDSDHLVLYSEPGKHAFAPTPAWFQERRQRFKRSETSALAGAGGILLAPYIQGQVHVTPLKTRLVHTYLSQQAFEPAWDFSQVFRFPPPSPPSMGGVVPWPDLRQRSGLPADYEFSFNALSSAPLRRRVFAALAGADFEGWAVVVDKTTLPDPFKVMRRLDFYLYFVTELMRLIPSAKREGATLILDEFGSASQVRTELRRFMKVRDIPRQFKRILIKRSKSESLIQIAGLMAGAILRRDAKGDVGAYDYVAGKLQRVLEFRG